MDRIKLVSLFLFIIFIDFSSAIIASSSSYSASMFGNSISTGFGNSGSYSATFLMENKGTTSNALGNSFMNNIGFFESEYFTTVSINSYLISSRSVVIGNTVGLSVTALNAESVWVEITSPDSQVQTLNLVNGQILNYLPVPSIVGRYGVVFYANSSSGAIASVSDYFDLIEQPQQNSGGSGSGGSSGGGSSGIQSCNYNWDCTPWSLCSNGIQTRNCVNIGTCVGDESKPIEVNSCSQSLFDVSINLRELLVDESVVKFNVDLIEQFGIDEIDVHLKYSIINDEDYEIFSQIETLAIKDKLSFEKTINFDLIDGDYILRVDVLYGNLQRAFAEQSFVVDSNEGLITGLALAEIIDSRKTLFSVLLLVISSLILLANYFYFNLRKDTTKISNLLSNVIGLDVYTDSGVKIGKAYDLIIENNKIHGVAVIVDRNAPINHEKVLIRYEYIQNVKDVVLVDSIVLEHNHESTNHTA